MNRHQYLISPEISWVTPSIIAQASRPGYPCNEPYLREVNAWVAAAKRMGIRSVLCLLSTNELEQCYEVHGISLLECYGEAGLKVHHFPIKDHAHPALTAEETTTAIQVLRLMEKPVVVHCSAGVGRTGHVIEAWREQVESIMEGAPWSTTT